MHLQRQAVQRPLVQLQLQQMHQQQSRFRRSQTQVCCAVDDALSCLRCDVTVCEGGSCRGYILLCLSLLSVMYRLQKPVAGQPSPLVRIQAIPWLSDCSILALPAHLDLSCKAFCMCRQYRGYCTAGHPAHSWHSTCTGSRGLGLMAQAQWWETAAPLVQHSAGQQCCPL